MVLCKLFPLTNKAKRGLFSLLDNTYIKVEAKHCSDDQYGTFKTLNDARMACTSDKTCSMVYDDVCDNDVFYLCPIGSAQKASTIGSCLYIKQQRPDDSGKLCSLCTVNCILLLNSIIRHHLNT